MGILRSDHFTLISHNSQLFSYIHRTSFYFPINNIILGTQQHWDLANFSSCQNACGHVCVLYFFFRGSGSPVTASMPSTVTMISRPNFRQLPAGHLSGFWRKLVRTYVLFLPHISAASVDVNKSASFKLIFAIVHHPKKTITTISAKEETSAAVEIAEMEIESTWSTNDQILSAPVISATTSKTIFLFMEFEMKVPTARGVGPLPEAYLSFFFLDAALSAAMLATRLAIPAATFLKISDQLTASFIFLPSFICDSNPSGR